MTSTFASTNEFCMLRRYISLLIWIVIIVSCSTSGPRIFKKQSPHQQYADHLNDAGLQNTGLGRLWFNSAESAILKPMAVALPFSESGYFPAEKPESASWKFSARRGEKLIIDFTKTPSTGFIIYLELYEIPVDERPRLLSAADTSGRMEAYEIRKDGEYLIRLQPELLRGGEYEISISVGPSLGYPINAPGKNHIQSYWGDARDRGARKHEGIDLFAPKRTPVIASADGYVTRVQETEVGGKVVWLRPTGKEYSLYYAHLDSQLVKDGQQVKAGEVIGLVGNTGNARGTVPHLHFGIYGRGGAVDPFPFVRPDIQKPPEIKADTRQVGKWIRYDAGKGKLYVSPDTKQSSIAIEGNTVLQNKAALANWYRVELPDGRSGFIPADKSNSVVNPLRKIKVSVESPVFDRPDSLAARKMILSPGNSVQVLGVFDNYYLVRNEDESLGWISQKIK